MDPNDVNNSNQKLVKKALYGRKIVQQHKIAVSSFVRKSKTKRTFHKGYLTNYTEEIFQINKVLIYRPYQYKLEDLMSENLS